MTNLCSDGLHALLTENGRELQDVKFLRGTSPSPEGMCEEAKRVIDAAMTRGMPHNPPSTGLDKSKL
ncbi:MAG: hypothetical protein ACPG5U_06420 [Planktomarina sp.]